MFDCVWFVICCGLRTCVVVGFSCLIVCDAVFTISVYMIVLLMVRLFLCVLVGF